MAKAKSTDHLSSIQRQDSKAVVFDSERVEKDVKYIAEFLTNEGFRPEITNSGRVYFKFEGHHIYFQANADDDQQFCLFIPNIFPIESGDRDMAIWAANFVSEKFVCVKAVYLECNEVWIAYEGYAPSVQLFALIINRMVERLQYGARRFVDVFNEFKAPKILN